mgnify:CR=1 FL=1
MKTKLIENNSTDLVIFLAGWGCDDVQFKNITCTKNLLLCWDYFDLEFDFNFSSYKQIDLIAYSAGVFVSGLIQGKLPKLNSKIAINGNVKIFDEYFGISKFALGFMHNLNLDNYMDFRRKFLVNSEEELKDFNKNSSVRTFESCENELKALQNYYAKYKPTFKYDVAILSENDKVFVPNHQKEYYKNKYVELKNNAHNVFYTFKSFDSIIDFAKI